MRICVPSFEDVISKEEATLFILYNPIPAPNPSDRAFAEAVE